MKVSERWKANEMKKKEKLVVYLKKLFVAHIIFSNSI